MIKKQLRIFSNICNNEMFESTLELVKSIPNESNVLDTKLKARITSNFEQLKLKS